MGYGLDMLLQLIYTFYMPYNILTEEEKRIIENKGTEPAYSGEYDAFYKEGTYICKKCNNPLFSSKAKFDAGCGWPSFDENYPNSINNLEDPTHNMIRTEIQCSNCKAHLGHVFRGENLTDKNTRHCVNSLSIKFIPKGEQIPELLTE